MAVCVPIQRKKTVVCTGDLRWRISIASRALTSPSGNNVDFTETFVDVVTIWAMVESIAPFSTLNSVTVDSFPTHRFIIRYRSDVTSENFIKFDGKYYDILDVLEPDNTKDYLCLYCLETGSQSKAAAQIGQMP